MGSTEHGGLRVLIVEDHALLARTLAMALTINEVEVHVAELDGPESVVEQAARTRPNLVLLDLDLGDQDGLALVSALARYAETLLVITGCTDECRLAAALALGAAGWVSKTEPFERLVEASEIVMHRRHLLPLANHETLVQSGQAWLALHREVNTCMQRLTRREIEVLSALEQGRSAQEIADQLVVSLGTIRTHIQAVLTKLGVSSQLAAVAKAGALARWERTSLGLVGTQ